MDRPLHEWAIDGVSVATIVGVFIDILPAVAALAAAIWYAVLIWESPVGLRWRARTRCLFGRVKYLRRFWFK